jgi:hypothetical protein
LHAEGKKLGVDVASWNRIWNFSLIGSDTGIDFVYNMDTYDWGSNMTRWEIEANKVWESGGGCCSRLKEWNSLFHKFLHQSLFWD